jgi:hypothetical protein
MLVVNSPFRPVTLRIDELRDADGLLMSDAEGKSSHWYTAFSAWETVFDRCLKISEACVVLTITALLILLVIRQVHWVSIACDGAISQQRIEASLKMVNDNWKVGILILIPLFYRTTRMFLERVRKVWWLEAEPEAVVKTQNPPEPEDEDEEE